MAPSHVAGQARSIQHRLDIAHLERAEHVAHGLQNACSRIGDPCIALGTGKHHTRRVDLAKGVERPHSSVWAIGIKGVTCAAEHIQLYGRRGDLKHIPRRLGARRRENDARAMREGHFLLFRYLQHNNWGRSRVSYAKRPQRAKLNILLKVTVNEKNACF